MDMMASLDIIDQKITLKNYNMKKFFLIIALAITSLSSCQQKENKLLTKKNSKVDFLKNLTDICAEDDGVFKSCDELFTKDGSSLFFLIIPKIGATKWYNLNKTKDKTKAIFEVNNLMIEKINKINKSDLSKQFDIWLFNIDKKYTKYVGLNAPYNLKTPRIVELYYLKTGLNNWEKQGSFEVKNEKDENKENKWRSDFIDKKIKKSNENPVINIISDESKISNKWDGKYSAYFSYGKIGGDNAFWILEIEIKKGLIRATGEGYQISFSDLLSGSENKNTLLLKHLKNISGYKLGKKMNPEFILVEEKGKFYITSDWIDKDIITKPNKYGYEMSKE